MKVNELFCWELTTENIKENGIDKAAYGFVYDTKCLVNGYHYIGQRKFSNGWEKYLGSGIKFIIAVREFGKESFVRSIIEVAESQEELNKLEQVYIQHVDATKNEDYYNISNQTNPPMSGKHHSEKSNRKNSKSHIGLQLGKNNGMYGKNHTEETKKKQSDLKKGKNHPLYGKYGSEHPSYGRHVLEESKQKQRISMTGKHDGEKNPFYNKKHTKESIQKMVDAHSISVVLLNTCEIFKSAKLASKQYSVPASRITACCKGKRKSAGKHPETSERLVWKYYK